MAHVITILAEGFEELEAVSYIDIIRRAGIEITLLGLTSCEVTGGHGITIRAQDLLQLYSGSYDGIILPGGGPGTDNLLKSDLVIKKVRDAFERGLLCAAVCAAPSIFGKAGILNGKKAVCYPGVEDNLTGATVSLEPVLKDGTIITSRGIGTSIAFALEIVTFLTDASNSSKIAKQILY